MNLILPALGSARNLTQDILSQLVKNPAKYELLGNIFGESFNKEAAWQWLQQEAAQGWKNFPQVELRFAQEINNAQGVYATLTNTIYLAEELVAQQDPVIISQVLLEEYGHFLDAQFNHQDALGDEGELFSGYLQGRDWKDAEIAAISHEDDQVTLVLDNEQITVEQANLGDNPAFDLIGLTQLRNDPQFEGIDGTGFSVAIIDTGLDYNHPLIAPNYVAGFDFIDNDDDPLDPEGHGTHVSGIVGAADEAIGVAPDAGLIGLRVLDQNGAGFITEVEDALEWVLANREKYNITAVNLSLGIGFFTSDGELQGDILLDDIRRLEDAGVTVISAAGNDYFANSGQPNQANLSFPAISSTIAVGAVWQDGVEPNAFWQDGSIDFSTGADRIVSFSQRLNASNVIFAPGAVISSTVPGGGIGNNAGTSQAAPHVAGAVALLQEASLEFSGRLLAPDEVIEILRLTGEPIFDGDDENDNIENTNATYVRIDIYGAISEVVRRSGISDNPANGLGSGDSNGTISGAFIGPILDGSPTSPLQGSIGRDGDNIRENDVDMYRFEVQSPGTVIINVASDSEGSSTFDSYLQLFDARGNSLGVNDNLEPNNPVSRIDAVLQPGTYYVAVSGNGNTSYDPNVAGSGTVGDTGNYSLEFSLNNQDRNGLLTGATDVNLGNDLEPLIFPEVIGTDFGQEVGVSDVDLYRIVAPDNGALLIDIDTPYVDNFVDSFLRLFDANGNELIFSNSNGQLAENDDGLAFNIDGENVEFASGDISNLVLEIPNQTTLTNGQVDDAGNYVKGNYGHETDSFLAARVNAGQVYYVGVSDFFNENYDPNSLNNRPETGAGGNYELIVSFVNDDINGSITQANQITPLPVQNLLQEIGQDDDQTVGDRDVDFYRFNAAQSGILEVAVNSDIVDPLNSVILLFDAAGNRLGVNDQINSNDALLRFQITPNTDYYAAVTGFGNQNFDPFALGSGTGGDIGSYRLNASLRPLAEAASLSDNTIASPAVQAVSVGSTQFGDIGSDSGFIVGDTDVDLYRFVPDTSETVTITTITSEGFSADTYLRLFDTAGNEIAANNDISELNQGSLIRLEVVAGTEYYIGVSGNDGQLQTYNPATGEGSTSGSTGGYNLSLSSGSDSITGSTVYRFFQPQVGVHFYTASEVERDFIIENLPNYNFEGASFDSVAEVADSLTGAKPVYRFFNNLTGAHLYTTSEVERESIINNLPNFSDEGVAYYGYETEQPNSVPLYRFYNNQVGVHFYTPSSQERDLVLDSLPDYQIESGDGVAFYVKLPEEA